MLLLVVVQVCSVPIGCCSGVQISFWFLFRNAVFLLVVV